MVDLTARRIPFGARAPWLLATAATLVVGALAFRAEREIALRTPRAVGNHLRGIDPASVTRVELLDALGHKRVSSAPAIVRACLTAAQNAKYSTQTGAYRDSVLSFIGTHEKRLGSFRLNVGAVRRDMGPAMADGVETLQRRGTSDS